MHMRILIVEDEPKTARLLREFILEADADNTVLAICDSIKATVAWLEGPGARPDLIFMDIHLADGISFEVFRKTRVESPVVFCTAFEEYTLQAFKSGGIDYILKPFRKEDIDAVFAKVGQLKRSLASTVGELVYNSFLVKYRDKMYPVAIKDIALIAFEQEIAYLYTFDGEKHPLFKGIDEVDAALDRSRFFRINRQMIVCRDAIKEVTPYFNRKVLVHVPVTPVEKPVVSRLKVSDFLSWIERGSRGK